MSILTGLSDWRVRTVLIALAAVGTGLALFAPNLIAAAVPLLIVAACPLSMVVMMRTMGDHQPNPSVRPNGSVDRRSRLRDRLAAAQLDQLRLEQELARLNDGNDEAADTRAPAPAADLRARSS
ncbi:MAG TPA: DUF2933 domain-containing protein [Candidatus Limnocylindrales bacterium]|jgi:hypothetical protein|nr:DUF2933 domain-containing protein [Candidatus Limnocylindrales bacterium]